MTRWHPVFNPWVIGSFIVWLIAVIVDEMYTNAGRNK